MFLLNLGGCVVNFWLILDAEAWARKSLQFEVCKTQNVHRLEFVTSFFFLINIYVFLMLTGIQHDNSPAMGSDQLHLTIIVDLKH